MHIESLVNKGLFEILPKILESKYENIFEQGAWAVGNISAEDAYLKGLLLEKKGILEALDAKIRTTNNDHILAHTTWALCNLMSGSDGGSKLQNKRKPIGLLALFHVMKHHQELDLLQGVLGAIADNLDVDQIGSFLHFGLVSRLFELGKHKYKQILHPVLRIAAMITNGTDSQTGSLIEFGGIDFIFQVLTDPTTDNYCKTKSLWIISNVVVGPFEHRDYVFRRPEWVDVLFNYAKQGHQSVGAMSDTGKTRGHVRFVQFDQRSSSKSCEIPGGERVPGVAEDLDAGTCKRLKVPDCGDLRHFRDVADGTRSTGRCAQHVPSPP